MRHLTLTITDTFEGREFARMLEKEYLKFPIIKPVPESETTIYRWHNVPENVAEKMLAFCFNEPLVGSLTLSKIGAT